MEEKNKGKFSVKNFLLKSVKILFVFCVAVCLSYIVDVYFSKVFPPIVITFIKSILSGICLLEILNIYKGESLFKNKKKGSD